MAGKKPKPINLDTLHDELLAIDFTKADGESLKLSSEAEKVIYRLLEIEDFIADTKTKLRDRFLQIAQKNPKLKKYEGDFVSVGYRTTRRKMIKGEPDEKFVRIEKKPNAKAIDAYRDVTGKLPKGITESIFEYITFKTN